MSISAVGPMSADLLAETLVGKAFRCSNCSRLSKALLDIAVLLSHTYRCMNNAGAPYPRRCHLHLPLEHGRIAISHAFG